MQAAIVLWQVGQGDLSGKVKVIILLLRQVHTLQSLQQSRAEQLGGPGSTCRMIHASQAEPTSRLPDFSYFTP